MKRREFLGAASMAVLSLSARPPARLPAWRPGGAGRLIERWSWAMGQPVHLMLFADVEDEGYEAAALALAELRRVEARLSLFDSASDLVELNRQAGRGPMRVDADLAAVLQAAAGFRRSTAGAFNAAVEPLMRVWGFRSPRTVEPTPAEVREACEAAEAAVVVVDEGRVTLPSRQTQLDFGGIAVGYGLDRMASLLRGLGVGRAFIDISGDCLAIGAPPGSSGWPVSVVDPGNPGGTLGQVRLRDQALATSANTVSVVRYGARLRGHVMDPFSGYPANRRLQATAVARTGIAADALSTAMLVAGKILGGVERAIFA
jgi:thiamine biosynthesis lipoprotein